MRIAIVNHIRRKVGGTEVYLSAIIPALAAAGHRVANLYEVEGDPQQEAICNSAADPRWSVESLGAAEALAQLRAWKPNIVYTHGLADPALEAEILGSAPSVSYVHNYDGQCISGDKSFKFPVMQPCTRKFGAACLLHYFPHRCGGSNPLTMLQLYSRMSARNRLLHKCNALLTNSEHMSAELKRYGLDAQCVYLFPPSPASTIANLPEPSGSEPWRLLFAGRMQPLKGARLLMDALPLARSRVDRNFHVTIAGDGDERAACERLSHCISGVNFEFTGWIGSAQLRDLLSRTHLLVMPSIWPEPFGLMGIEAAMQSGPAVGFATGGIPEWLIDDVTGMLAKGERPRAQALADAIVRALDPARYPGLRRAAAEHARRFSLDEHVYQLERVFARCAQ